MGVKSARQWSTSAEFLKSQAFLKIFFNFTLILHFLYFPIIGLGPNKAHMASEYNERRERGRGAPSPCKRDHMGIFFVESALAAFRNPFPKTKRFA